MMPEDAGQPLAPAQPLPPMAGGQEQIAAAQPAMNPLTGAPAL